MQQQKQVYVFIAGPAIHVEWHYIWTKYTSINLSLSISIIARAKQVCKAPWKRFVIPNSILKTFMHKNLRKQNENKNHSISPSIHWFWTTGLNFIAYMRKGIKEKEKTLNRFKYNHILKKHILSKLIQILLFIFPYAHDKFPTIMGRNIWYCAVQLLLNVFYNNFNILWLKPASQNKLEKRNRNNKHVKKKSCYDELNSCNWHKALLLFWLGKKKIQNSW